MSSEVEVVLVGGMNIQSLKVSITLTDPSVTVYYRQDSLPIWIGGHTNGNN